MDRSRFSILHSLDDLVQVIRFKPALFSPFSACNNWTRLVKDSVDLFKSSARRLRIEEIDERNKAEVEHGKDQIAFPALLTHHRRRQHDRRKVPYPVGRSRDSIASRTKVQW